MPLNAVLIAAAGVYAWWATGLRPFTTPSLVAVLGGGLLGMALGAVLLAPRALLRSPPRRVRAWAGLLAALGLWQLASFVQHPRSEHPTISSLANTGLESHPVRAVALLLWLIGAAFLARR